MAKAKAVSADMSAETTTEVAVHDEAWAAYQAEQEAKSGNRRPTPPGIRLNGKTGVFSRSQYDSETKETKFTDLEEKSFDGVILAVKFFAKWKFSDAPKYAIQTKEFSDFMHERIELTKRETVAGAVATSKFYDSYSDFKEQVTQVDKETGDSKVPFDLFVSLYILKDGEIVRYRGKGETRSAWFDYTKIVKSPKTVLTEFGVSDLITHRIDKYGKKVAVPVPYYHGTFASKGDVPAELRSRVIEAARDLDTWFASFTQEVVAPKIAAPVHAALPSGSTDDEEEIKIEDIGF